MAMLRIATSSVFCVYFNIFCASLTHHQNPIKTPLKPHWNPHQPLKYLLFPFLVAVWMELARWWMSGIVFLFQPKMSLARNSKILQYLHHRLKITLLDGRIVIGQMVNRGLTSYYWCYGLLFACHGLLWVTMNVLFVPLMLLLPAIFCCYQIPHNNPIPSCFRLLLINIWIWYWLIPLKLDKQEEKQLKEH